MGKKARSIGSVLLTGRNGFIAYHIIATISEEDPDCVIHSLGNFINSDQNRHQNSNVHYQQADIASASDVEGFMTIAQPGTIFYRASPVFRGESKSTYTRIIVDETYNLLSAIEKV
jgi:sterol-4alpha-carboxylate 3-dehydrogenase (decarboxylating)